MKPWDVIVVGAGAAGLLAATRAAERGRSVLLLEKNRKPGVKILMSGGTRCNLTHATDKWGIIEAFGRQGQFLHSPLAALGPQDLVDLFEAEGLPTKVETTGKIFPESDRAADVLRALLRRLERSGAQLSLAETVIRLDLTDQGVSISTDKQQYEAAKIIITSGGQSYPGCGTTGDGYDWARLLGHTIAAPRPALVPLTCDTQWARRLPGVTMPDVAVRLLAKDAGCLDSRRGSLLFTHFGVSGPVVLDVSGAATAHSGSQLTLECDFAPDQSAEQLAQELQTAAAQAGRRQASAILAAKLPRRLAEELTLLAGLPDDRRAAELSRSERAALVGALKGAALHITGTLGFKKAEVTAGGIALDEVDSRTMQSKLAPNVYFAGEMLDLDGRIGGYNFQAAFSTGWLAGSSV